MEEHEDRRRGVGRLYTKCRAARRNWRHPCNRSPDDARVGQTHGSHEAPGRQGLAETRRSPRPGACCTVTAHLDAIREVGFEEPHISSPLRGCCQAHDCHSRTNKRRSSCRGAQLSDRIRPSQEWETVDVMPLNVLAGCWRGGRAVVPASRQSCGFWLAIKSRLVLQDRGPIIVSAYPG